MGERSGWLIGLLLAAVVIPTACVLWFMNEAATGLAVAARQTVTDASRAQLRAIRTRLNDEWTRRAKELDARPQEIPAARFGRLSQSGTADGILIVGTEDAASSVHRQHDAGEEPDDAGALVRTFLQAGKPSLSGRGLQPSHVPDVWQLVSPDGTAVALYRDETVHAITHAALDEHQSDTVHFAVFKPDEGAYDDALLIGHGMPGWQVSFTLLDIVALDQHVRARRLAYLWVGLLGGGLFALVLGGVAHAVRRQSRLTRMKTDMVAAVSHELRTPLASIRVLVDGLLRDAAADPVKTREYLSLIAVENNRLSRLIENFLTFARLERGRHPYAFDSVAVTDVVDAAVKAIRDRQYPDCDLRVEVEPDLPPIAADADALTTALVNLLDNAYKYSPADKRIAIRAYREGNRVCVAVQDNGIGIPAGEQKRIFRRFYRVDRRLSRDTSGVGLGLTIVDDVVRAHGGVITVASRPGEGSTFTMGVPAATGAQA
jgi:signal transduction histidine kinase